MPFQCRHSEMMAIGHECVCCCEMHSVKEKMEEGSNDNIVSQTMKGFNLCA